MVELTNLPALAASPASQAIALRATQAQLARIERAQQPPPFAAAPPR